VPHGYGCSVSAAHNPSLIASAGTGLCAPPIAAGRRWLQEIVDGSCAGPDDIAARESCSRRHVMMMISLSFLAPDLVAAAMQGRLPGGIGVTRLIDAPMEWSRQWHMLGL